MRALVTGGAGFIGSYISEALLRQGHSVVIVDDLSAGKEDNIKALLRHEQVEFHCLNITEKNHLMDIFNGIDWVFHLAGKADIVPSIEQPEVYFQTNVHGTLNVLLCAKKAQVKKFVYAASSSSYGLPDIYPTPENSPIRPQYPYALTKYMGEELVMHWGQVYQLPVISLRLFNVYGPRARTHGAYGAVFGVFLAQKFNGHPFTVVGDGTQTRDFTYVTDVADAFIKAAQSDQQDVVMNVGSGNHYSVNKIVELLGGDVTYIPKRPGEPDCTFADISRIQSLLEWQPSIDLDLGVANMLEHRDDWGNAPVWSADAIEEATQVWFNHLTR